ncbi:MAG: HD domain-containing protein [Verrucomicrobiae bacterium]|nr:HD domain-containing protein [Verrucomicrobiae bacterium]
MNHPAALAELRAVMDRLEPEPEHTRHVAALAVRLFDQLAPLHGLGPDHRVLLEGAGWLHDLGWTVSEDGSDHHKHSARLIREQSWSHLSAPDVARLALVARYHRKALPSLEHREFQALPATDRDEVCKLAAILRIADACDRSHLQAVRDVHVRILPDFLEFTLVATAPPLREIAGAGKKGDLARLVFERNLAFRHEAAPDTPADARPVTPESPARPGAGPPP